MYSFLLFVLGLMMGSFFTALMCGAAANARDDDDFYEEYEPVFGDKKSVHIDIVSDDSGEYKNVSFGKPE